MELYNIHTNTFLLRGQRQEKRSEAADQRVVNCEDLGEAATMIRSPARHLRFLKGVQFHGRRQQLSVSAPLSLEKYIQEHRAQLKPPVANRMIYNEQLQVMVVGGPNQRKDFHINEGEEVFYQIEGGMELKILEQGQHKTIVIPEGHMFILPSRIPHSPQRFENTIGMVFERLRHKHESDGLRYFVGDTTEVLYEEYFHCKDLGSELVPVINRFFASDAYKTNKPGPDMPISNPPVVIDDSALINSPPFDWSKFLVDLRSTELLKSSEGVLVENAVAGAEFSLNIAFGGYKGVIQPKRIGKASDTFLWQIRGNSIVTENNSNSVQLRSGDIHLAMTGEELIVDQHGEDSCLVAVTNNAFE